jgi:hypothetical protein
MKGQATRACPFYIVERSFRTVAFVAADAGCQKVAIE